MQSNHPRRIYGTATHSAETDTGHVTDSDEKRRSRDASACAEAAENLRGESPDPGLRGWLYHVIHGHSNVFCRLVCAGLCGASGSWGASASCGASRTCCGRDSAAAASASAVPPDPGAPANAVAGAWPGAVAAATAAVGAPPGAMSAATALRHLHPSDSVRSQDCHPFAVHSQDCHPFAVHSQDCHLFCCQEDMSN